MLSIFAVCLLLLSSSIVRANLGQDYNNNQNVGLDRIGSNNNQGLNNNNGYSGLGQGYNQNQNQYQRPGLGQGYSSNNNGGYPGLGQGTNNQYSGLGQNNGQGYQSNSDLLNARATAYSGSDRSDDDGYDRTTGLNSKPLNQQGGYYPREKRDLGQQTEPKGVSSDSALGQAVKPVGLGSQDVQAVEPQGLGQAVKPVGLGSQDVGLSEETKPTLDTDQSGSLSGSLRKKRYAEQEPYRKSCNTYYGKYICYRLYDTDASIPNDFTCWKTYVGKKNCTETENILYLDRRNVEIDPAEQLDRQFYPNSDAERRGHSEIASRSRYNQRDDEFGAVEQNLHNQRHGDRRLPNDDDFPRSRAQGRREK